MDASFDRNRLADAIAALALDYPHVDLHVKTAQERDVMTELQEGRAHIGLINFQAGIEGKTIDGRDIALARHHIIAAPDHPLTQLTPGFPLIVLDDHRQIIVADYAPEARKVDYRVHTTDVQIVDSYDMQIELIRRGTGWGFALDHHIADDLRSGRLVEFRCAAIEHPGFVRFGAVWMVKTPPGPAAMRLLDLIGKADAYN